MANPANRAEPKIRSKRKGESYEAFYKVMPFFFVLFSDITKYYHHVIIILITSDMLFSFSTVLSSQPPLRSTGIHTALPEHILLRCPLSKLH